MEIKDDKSIEAFQSAPDVDNDPDVDKDPNVDNEGNTIFEEEGSNGEDNLQVSLIQIHDTFLVCSKPWSKY